MNSYYSVIGLLFGLLSSFSSVDGSNDCAYFGPTPANECGGYIAELDQSYGYYCIDDTTIEERWFTGEGCDANQLGSTFTHSCDGQSDGCNCQSDNQCESVELISQSCNGLEPSGIVTETSKRIINVCIQDGTTSGLYECDADGNLVDKTYLGDAQCDEELASTVIESAYGNDCSGELATAYSSTCPTTDSCETDGTSNGYNDVGLFRHNGGCQEHFSALITQDKTGDLSYLECYNLCKSNANCKSYLFGKPGVVRANWCNIYNVVCSDNGDTDWYAFTPYTSNVEAICDA